MGGPRTAGDIGIRRLDFSNASTIPRPRGGDAALRHVARVLETASAIAIWSRASARRVRDLAPGDTARTRVGGRRAYSRIGGAHGVAVGAERSSAHDVVRGRLVSGADSRFAQSRCRGRCGAVSGQAGGRNRVEKASFRSLTFTPLGFWGRQASTGLVRGTVACPGSQSPGKSTGTIHKPILNCSGCVSFGFTHLREWQPA